MTGTTAGSRCSSSTYSSSFDCPAACVWSAERLRTKPECAGLPRPTLPPGASAANATCLLHPPCSSGSSSGDPAAADGPCFCCDLQLDSSFQSTAAGTVPAAQLWVLFLGQLLFLSWVLFLTRAQVSRLGCQACLLPDISLLCCIPRYHLHVNTAVVTQTAPHLCAAPGHARCGCTGDHR